MNLAVVKHFLNHSYKVVFFNRQTDKQCVNKIFHLKKPSFFFLTQEILSGMLHMVQAPYITAQ